MADLSSAVAALTEAVRALINRGQNEEVPALKEALDAQVAANQALQAAFDAMTEAEAAEDVAQQEALDQAKADLEKAQSDAQEAADALEALLEEIKDAVDNPPDDGAHPDNTLPNEIPVEGEPPVINPLR